MRSISTVHKLALFTFMLGLEACAPTQHIEDRRAKAPDYEAASPSFATVHGFHRCPLSYEDAHLIGQVTQGKLVPASRSDLDDSRLPLTISEMNEWLTGVGKIETIPVPLVMGSLDQRPVFVAIFDGTWNDRDDPRQPSTVPGLLSRELEVSAETQPNLQVRYYRGVGTQTSSLNHWWEGATGKGTVTRAEMALDDYLAYARRLGENPHAYVIGFSRGAASARHFLNLLDPLIRPRNDDHVFSRPRSFALLIDTVATGQYNALRLDLPQTTLAAVQLRATRERRFSFPIVPLQSAFASDLNGQMRDEILLPAAHADLGGGYGKGLELLTLKMAETLLVRQGFSIDVKRLEEQAALNMGRHNSDWPGTPWLSGYRALIGGADRRLVDPGKQPDLPAVEDPVMTALESSVRTVEAAKATLDRTRRDLEAGKPISPTLSIMLIASGTELVVNTNCPEYVQLDARSRWVFLAKEPLMRISARDVRKAESGLGKIWLFPRLEKQLYVPDTTQ